MSKIHPIRCEFLNEDIEEEFRNDKFEQSRFQVTIGFIVMALSMIYFVRTDTFFISDVDVHDEVLYLRIFYSVITFTMLFLFRKTKLFQMADIVILIWAIFTAVVVSFINVSRDAEYMYHHITDVLIIMSFYIFFYNRLIYQMIPSLLYSLVNIIIFANVEVVSIVEVNTIVFAHIAVNFMGIYVSYMNNLNQRNLFLEIRKDES
jgi:hypothetical protein